MTAPAPAAVIFDMDGVLVDSGVHHRAAWRALLDELGVPPPPGDYWRLTIGRPGTEAVVRLLGRELTATEARSLARRKHEHYIERARAGLVAIPGVVDFVAELARRDVPRAVATSAHRVEVERLLAGVGLRAHFDVIIAADDVRRGKPDPEVYLRAADAIGRSPAACVVFEDAVVGVQAARRAGMRVVGVTTAYPEAELREAGAHRIIPDFRELRWPP